MLFNSYIFIFLFLPLVVILYFLLNGLKKYKAAEIFLIMMSLWFYGYYNPKYLIVICTSVLGNYLLSQAITRVRKSSVRKIILVGGILANVSSIFYFKYYNFFLQNVNSLFGKSFELENIVLPLGISFFTFQQISFLVDAYRGETKEYGFVEYALFVVFFPQLIAGPIVLHREVIPQFRDKSKRKIDYNNLSLGLYVFAMGLFKKVMIADTLSKAVAWGFSGVDALSSMEALIVALSYTFQLYFDFSGYCDMAVGIGHMLNIKLPQNFNSPYQATSIVDFWNRWHMSLTRFLRQYVYFPLGGSRNGKIRTYVNVMIVFLVSGIWHGANWTFIIWGVIHGVLNCLNRMFKETWEKLHIVTRWLCTFATINLLWVIFRAENIQQSITFFKRMFCLDDFSISDELIVCFDLPEILLLERKTEIGNYLCSHVTGINMWAIILMALFIVLNGKNSSQIKFKPTVLTAMFTVLLLVWSILSLAGVSEFLYFGF